MSESDQAVAYFRQGYSCSQAVLAPFATRLGLDRDLAFKLSTTFGGGMGHIGETCGAVTGALMVIGLAYGRTRADDQETKARAYELVAEFAAAFKQRHGSLHCTELVGYDLSTPEGRQQVQDQGLGEKLCTQFVHDAAEIVQDMLVAGGKTGTD